MIDGIKVGIEKTIVFEGSERSPLLAPRGVFVFNGRLFVADTAQNRLFIWNSLPTSAHQDPDIVLGQQAESDTGRNANGGANASSLFYPSGIWVNDDYLIVSDAWNHRVLIWHGIPTQNGQPADVVIGQQDFSSNQPNVDGVGRDPSEHTLYWPYGVYSDGKQLWIADTGNRRVLYFETIPTTNFAAATSVIGKPSFHERDYDHRDAIWPYSVKIGPNGEMAITDTQYYRVLLWRDWRTASEQGADSIIGQPAIEANGQNQFGWFPGPNTLNWCYDTCFHEEGLFVADTGNSRILWFDHIPKENNMPANKIIGQDDFKTGSENKNTIWSTEGSLYWPFQLCVEEHMLAAADTGNHRVVLHYLKREK